MSVRIRQTQAYYDSRYLRITKDTKANILASTPTTDYLAYATDSDEFYLYDGSNWKVAPLEFDTELQAPDMGAYNEYGLGASDRSGYHKDYITDKRLSNILIGANARTETGGLRIDVTQDPDTFEIYLRAAWQTIIYDLTTANSDFRHTPLSNEIYIWRGDSVMLGLTGRPVVQEYGASMGAYPPALILSGGEF